MRRERELVEDPRRAVVQPALVFPHARRPQDLRERGEPGAGLRRGEQVVAHAQVREHLELLEGPAHARARDAHRGERGELQRGRPAGAEPRTPGVAALEAADAVEERRLPGAVRTDQPGDRAAGDVEGDAVERDDALIPLDDALDAEDRAHADGARAAVPRRPSQVASPAGRNSTISSKMTPYSSERTSGAIRSSSGSAVNTTAPATGPQSVPDPPRITMISRVSDTENPNTPGSM